MSDKSTSKSSSGLEGKIERTAKTYSNVRTLVVAVLSAVGTIFGAGVYYNELRHQLDEYVKRIEKLESAQAQSQKDIVSLTNDVATEKQNIRVAINNAFVQLLQIGNAGPPFTNTEPRNNGGGFSPTQPPGRCPLGQVVVGVQPIKATDGIRSIVFQCGAPPKVHVD